MATPYDNLIEPGKPSELGLIAAQAGYRRAQADYAPLVAAAQRFLDLVEDIGDDWESVQVWIEREDFDALRTAMPKD